MKERVGMSVVKLALLHLRRKPYQSLAVFLSLFMIYTILIIFGLFTLASHQILQYFAAQPQITAFLKTQAQENQINQLIMQLQQTGKVKKVRFISQEQALKIYQKISKNPALLEVVDSSVLPASIEVSTYQPDDLEVVYKILETSNIVDDIIYQRDLVNLISRWIKNLRLIGLVLIALFSLQALTVMWVVTGFKISGFRQSIEIMRLLGAGKNYVAMIFALESFVIGLVSGLLAYGLSMFLVYKTQDVIVSLFGTALGISSIPYNWFLMALPGVVLATGLFGLMFTFLISYRFLKK